MANPLKIGIRELVEFCCRDGDLGYDNSPGVTALAGLQTHQKIQRRYRNSAESEVRVKYLTRIDTFDIELSGRIDLLFANESPRRIEEIKTVYAFTPGIEDDTLPWAQLKCYGAAFAQQHELDEITLSLNLVKLITQQEWQHPRQLTRSEMTSFVEEMLRQYLRWHRLVDEQRQQNRQQAQQLEFPFAQFRQQQRRFAAEVYRSITAQQCLLVEAPTGSGKTISTLFPAIKAIGEDQCDQIIYLSAKVSGQQQAVRAFELMPTGCSYLVIQAKARSCPCNFDDNEIDDEGRCRRCIGFFERLPAAREQLFRKRKLDVAQIQASAAEFQLCPFELTLQMLPWVDVIICDFNYVFDPLVQLGYFKNNHHRKLLLIDEIHNLVDRARSMYSANLTRRQIKKALAASNNRQISTALKAMQQALDRELRSQHEDQVTSCDLPVSLLQASYRFSEKLGSDIFSNKRIAAETIEFSKAVFRFQCISQLFAQHHRVVGQKPLATRELKLLCLNAFEYLKQCYPLFQAVCGFSATLSPTNYFQQALGVPRDSKNLCLATSFPSRNLGVFIGNYVDLRYRQRHLHIDNICTAIATCYRARPGNYLVFFSAYLFMQQVYDRFKITFPEIDTLLQQRDFDASAQERFLAGFFASERKLGFAIMGGRFAEGIDYRGDALIGAIVVGVGLPQANHEQLLIQQDFDALQLNGFDHAFRFPGLIRVKQSAGRVIRDEHDRGVVVLLDQRFQHYGYRQHLPMHWRPQNCDHQQSLEQSLATFWADIDESDTAQCNVVI